MKFLYHVTLKWRGHSLKVRIPRRMLELWLSPEWYLESVRRSRDI